MFAPRWILLACGIAALSSGTLVGQTDARAVPPSDPEQQVKSAEPDCLFFGPDRVEAVRQLAERLGVVVLLKGDRTIVATPDGMAWANPTGTAALASAGTGDVLAGLIVSLLAAGLQAFQAAVAGAFVHGLAGRRAVDELGGEPAPVTATEVAAALPQVIASLG